MADSFNAVLKSLQARISGRETDRQPQPPPLPEPGTVKRQVHDAVRQGLTLRQAAALVGVHVATVCRWQTNDAAFRAALVDAREQWRKERPRKVRPTVKVHPDCPVCGSSVKVLAAGEGIGPRFWRCSSPACSWQSWRPRHPEDCPGCGKPRLWAQSRLSVVCVGCGVRSPAIATGPDKIGYGPDPQSQDLRTEPSCRVRNAQPALSLVGSRPRPPGARPRRREIRNDVRRSAICSPPTAAAVRFPTIMRTVGRDRGRRFRFYLERENLNGRS
jgi:hypothetical protein